MEAAIALIAIFYGVRWAATEGFRANRSAVRSRRAGTRDTASQRGTSTHRVGSTRRAARSAGLGYWLHAIRHGFPVEREGIARGWRDHQHAAQTAQTDGTRERADHDGVLARLRAEAAAHKHRLEVAARQRQHAGHPNMSDQLRAAPVTGAGDPQPPEEPIGDPHHMGAPGKDCTNPDCSCHKTPPLADGSTPGAPPASNGHSPGPASNGGPMTDTTIDSTSQGAEGVKTLADHSSNNADLESMIQICDGLDEATNGDKDCAAAGMELVQAIRARQAADTAMSEAAGTLQNEVEKYRQVQEARDASGKELPKDGFVAH